MRKAAFIQESPMSETSSNETNSSAPGNIARDQSSNKDRVLIFDTTLRDGEQSPGASMTFEEKLQVADMLDER